MSIEMTPDELRDAVLALRLYRHPIQQWYSLHQPVTLLWALGRLDTGADRLCPWELFEQEVTPLLADFSNGEPTAQYPFYHLSRSPLWEIDGIPETRGFNPTPRSLAAARACAGFTEQAFQLLQDTALRTKIVNLIRVRYLSTVENDGELLARVGLNGHATASGAENPPVAGEPEQRRKRVMSEVSRDPKLADKVKELHDNTCQFCAARLAMPSGFVIDAAHIRGRGDPHNGPDVLSNLLCLCPNCHRRFDGYGIYIDEDDVVRAVNDGESVGRLRRSRDHILDDAQIRYHRRCCPISHGAI